MTMPFSVHRPAETFAAAYDLLARAYLNGAAALREAASAAPGSLAPALGELEPALPAMLDALLLRSEAECARAEQALASCFGLPLPGRYAPPMASVYLDGGQLWGPPAHQVMDLYEACSAKIGLGTPLGPVTVQRQIWTAYSKRVDSERRVNTGGSLECGGRTLDGHVRERGFAR